MNTTNSQQAKEFMQAEGFLAPDLKAFENKEKIALSQEDFALLLMAIRSAKVASLYFDNDGIDKPIRSYLNKILGDEVVHKISFQEKGKELSDYFKKNKFFCISLQLREDLINIFELCNFPIDQIDQLKLEAEQLKKFLIQNPENNFRISTNNVSPLHFPVYKGREVHKAFQVLKDFFREDNSQFPQEIYSFIDYFDEYLHDPSIDKGKNKSLAV